MKVKTTQISTLHHDCSHLLHTHLRNVVDVISHQLSFAQNAHHQMANGIVMSITDRQRAHCQSFQIQIQQFTHRTFHFHDPLSANRMTTGFLTIDHMTHLTFMRVGRTRWFFRWVVEIIVIRIGRQSFLVRWTVRPSVHMPETCVT